MNMTAIGIDLGTTNSCFSAIIDGEPQILTNSEGARVTPSVVAFTEDGERLVGITAKRQIITNPERSIASVKREMGSDWTKKIDDNDFSPQEISAFILQKIKADAEARLGKTIEQAVITCPAYFTDAQRKATRDSGRIAGLEVLRIINEPTAAALAYGVDKEEDQTILVFDLGGGTFDVSLLEIYQVDGQPQIEVKSTNGDNRLGGDDFDEAIVQHILTEFKSTTGIDLVKDSQAMSRLKEGAEKAKIELSSSASAQVNLPFITMRDGQPEHLDMNITRSTYEHLVDDLVERTMKPVDNAMKDAGVKKNEIDKVILVGGSTRMPIIVESIEKRLGIKPYQGINPDEAVAIGAALQAGILSGEEGVKDVLLLDVTPLSLGIETLGGVMTTLIERNTTIPTRKTEVFSTAADGQPAVEIHVLQGEREFAGDNITLGKFQLIGIPPAPRGIPQIEVSFDIDANGITSVAAKDLGTGKEQSIKIEAQTSLSEDEIEQKVQDAEMYAGEDQKRKAKVELRNQADAIVYQTRKTLTDNQDKVEGPLKERLESSLDQLDGLINKDGAPIDMSDLDEAAIQSKISELESMMYEFSEAIYEQAQASDDGTQSPTEDDVVDAEFEIVDEDEES